MKKKEFAFVRTEQQIDKIIKECNQIENPLILYTIVETKLAKYLSSESDKNNLPCFGILGNLILSFSKLLNQKAIHKPSAQHVLDDDYYQRIEAIQYTMAHDDGKKLDDVNNADDNIEIRRSRVGSVPPPPVKTSPDKKREL